MVQTDSFGWPTNSSPYQTEFNGVMSLFQRKKIQALAHATLMLLVRLKYVEWTAEVFHIKYTSEFITWHFNV